MAVLVMAPLHFHVLYREQFFARGTMALGSNTYDSINIHN